MPITLDNAAEVIDWKARQVLGFLPEGITLNFDPGLAWADRFIEWPTALLGPPPTKAVADTWADEWTARTKTVRELARELFQAHGPGILIEALGELMVEKGVVTTAELRAKLLSKVP